MGSPSQHSEPTSGVPATSFPVLPDYRGSCLSNVVPALLGPPDAAEWLPAPVREAKAVVLFLIDGMGWEQLQDRAELTPVLSAMEGGPITTVAPTTTTTALTSLVTGAAPGEHGLIGYQIYIQGQVLNALRWTAGPKSSDARRAIVPEQIQPRPAFFGRRVPAVGRSEFQGTGFTRAHLDGVDHKGYKLTSSIAVEVQKLVDEGEPLVYAYYDGPDRIAHEYGFGPYLDAEFAEVDRLVAQILAVLPSEAALLVVSDHGQVMVGDNKVELARDVLALTAVTSGEARFRWLHARPGRAGELLDAATERYGRHGLVVERQQVLDEEWLGPHVGPEARSRMGDVALVPSDPVAFVEPKPEPRSAAGGGGRPVFELLGRHGSLTSAEMLIPCLAASGTRS
ncbi:MAG: alkaline phosphatase family protein [Acidimicrobiia bacterium]|nr:alkaline phosphatase family protein [Acidimicrobiia bacterium]MXZ87153.1 alkaline phosphatase family protein [Acidimicrobiia bacterium]MYB75352.1 alkaline phosphatase family protein [Acidimicrobiia bacterium]MYG73579.1 alkaline phosphatase family protein [Acidimicrobiia bacterium]MYI00949.1 alkaline phosphatase family protein [Acidimicrobiia bacterium]